MSRAFRLRSLAVLAAALACASAQAYRSWLVPSATVVDAGGRGEPVVSVDAAGSEDLFEFDIGALQLDDVVVTAPDGSTSAGEARVATRRHLSFDVPLKQKGTYRISGLAETAMASWTADGETRRWRGPAAELARQVPAGAADLQVSRTLSRYETFASYDTPGLPAPSKTGVGIELQPLTSPTDLDAGDTTRLRLTLDGKPFADADVTLIRGGNRYRYKMGELGLKTDADGVVEVRWPEAGRYWLGVSHGGRGGPAAPARREVYTATFEVRPR